MSQASDLIAEAKQSLEDLARHVKKFEGDAELRLFTDVTHLDVAVMHMRELNSKFESRWADEDAQSKRIAEPDVPAEAPQGVQGADSEPEPAAEPDAPVPVDDPAAEFVDRRQGSTIRPGDREPSTIANTVEKHFESIDELEAAYPTIAALQDIRCADLPDGLTYEHCDFPADQLDRAAGLDRDGPGPGLR